MVLISNLLYSEADLHWYGQVADRDTGDPDERTSGGWAEGWAQQAQGQRKKETVPRDLLVYKNKIYW